MPTTLLAVEDSATMRKVLEMTFAGEDFRVVTVADAGAALAALPVERPAVVLADATLPGTSGYDLAATLKSVSPHLPVLVLASKQHPYDPGRGSAARADDFIEKPFDTQQLIDKVKRLAGHPVETTRPSMPAISMGPRAASTPPSASSLRASVPASDPRRTSPGMAIPTMGAGTMGTGTMPLGAQAAQAISAVSHSAPPPSFAAASMTPAPPRVSAPPAAAPAAAPPAAPQATFSPGGDLASKLAGLGLDAAQVAGVLALSREVVERVVWEVVPTLAETLIKEEIARLTRD